MSEETPEAEAPVQDEPETADGTTAEGEISAKVSKTEVVNQDVGQGEKPEAETANAVETEIPGAAKQEVGTSRTELPEGTQQEAMPSQATLPEGTKQEASRVEISERVGSEGKTPHVTLPAEVKEEAKTSQIEMSEEINVEKKASKIERRASRVMFPDEIEGIAGASKLELVEVVGEEEHIYQETLVEGEVTTSQTVLGEGVVEVPKPEVTTSKTDISEGVVDKEAPEGTVEEAKPEVTTSKMEIPEGAIEEAGATLEEVKQEGVGEEAGTSPEVSEVLEQKTSATRMEVPEGEKQEESEIETDVAEAATVQEDGVVEGESKTVEQSEETKSVTSERELTTVASVTSGDIKSQSVEDDIRSLFQEQLFGLFDKDGDMDDRPPLLSTSMSLMSIARRGSRVSKRRIDRSLYYSLHATTKAQYQAAKRINNTLQKKLAEYFLKKRVYIALYTKDNARPMFVQYHEKMLDEYGALTDRADRDQAEMKNELANLVYKRDVHRKELQMLVEQLEQAELEVIRSFAGRDARSETYQKYVDRYVRHQMYQIKLVSDLRLEHFKLRNLYVQKQEAFDALDSLGSQFRVMDYEQLKVDNRNLHDKLEEKELEMLSLRERCRHATQVVAHIRERMKGIEFATTDFIERSAEIDDEYESVREQLNEMKQQRDETRRSVNRLKAEAGLLTKKRLLRDMEKSIREVEILTEQVQVYKDDCQELTGFIRKLKKPKTTWPMIS